MIIKQKDIGRFLDYIRKEKSGCWTWTGPIDKNGYGRFCFNGRAERAHRVAHFLGKGPVQQQIDHLCRNRACVNPDHLEDVSAQENTLRGFGPGGMNARKTHCPKGHAYDLVYNTNRGPMRACHTCKLNRERKRKWRKKSS